MGPASGCSSRRDPDGRAGGAGAEPLGAGRPVSESHCPFSSECDHCRHDWTLPTHQDPSKVLGLYFGLWLKLSICRTFFSQVPIFRPFGFSFFAVCPQESSSAKTLFRCRDPKEDPRAAGADLGKQSFFFCFFGCGVSLRSAEEEAPQYAAGEEKSDRSLMKAGASHSPACSPPRSLSSVHAQHSA